MIRTCNVYFSDFDQFEGLKARLNNFLRSGVLSVTYVAQQFLRVKGDTALLHTLYQPNTPYDKTQE